MPSKQPHVTIVVVGLRDCQYSGATAHKLRKIKALGASATVAKTGRVTLTTASGERRVYALEMAPDYHNFTDAQLNAADSPLSRALHDLEVSFTNATSAMNLVNAARASAIDRGDPHGVSLCNRALHPGISERDLHDLIAEITAREDLRERVLRGEA